MCLDLIFEKATVYVWSDWNFAGLEGVRGLALRHVPQHAGGAGPVPLPQGAAITADDAAAHAAAALLQHQLLAHGKCG